jgi:hypothetical protein
MTRAAASPFYPEVLVSVGQSKGKKRGGAVKCHNMFQPIWPSSGVTIYLVGKTVAFVVAAITCVGPK